MNLKVYSYQVCCHVQNMNGLTTGAVNGYVAGQIYYDAIMVRLTDLFPFSDVTACPEPSRWQAYIQGCQCMGEHQTTSMSPDSCKVAARMHGHMAAEHVMPSRQGLGAQTWSSGS